MRLFLQHLQDPVLAVERANEMLNREGCLLIIDSVDKYRYYNPGLPKFKELFDIYRGQQIE